MGRTDWTRAAVRALAAFEKERRAVKLDLEAGPGGVGLAAYFREKRVLSVEPEWGEGPRAVLELNFAWETAGLALKDGSSLLLFPLARGQHPWGSPSLPLRAEDVGKAARLLALLLSSLALLREGLPGTGKRKRLLEKAEERLSRLASLLKEAASGKASGREVPFGFFSKGGEAVFWNEEEHPFPEPLALLPEGGLYRGPIPGRPGVKLEGLVLPGPRPRETRFFPRELEVGAKRLRSKDEEGFRLLAFPHVTPWEVLLRFPGVDPGVDALLKEGRLEEAAERIALNGIAGV